MKIQEIINFLNEIAPPALQESYDNCGLIVGNSDWDCKGIVTCLDSTEDVIDEAINNNCNLIVAHHPIVFSGLKSFTGKNYIERTIIKAIQNNIAIFAIHTNLDNVKHGVNGVWANALKLENQKILAPKRNLLKKIVVFVPEEYSEILMKSMFDAGAGHIGNYSECSFVSEGKGTFMPMEGSNPFVGEKNIRTTSKENKIEMICESFKLNKVLNALQKAHPYEEVAYDIFDLQNSNAIIGSGMIGELTEPMDTIEWLNFLKKTMNCGVVKYTNINKNKISKIAICGGSGSFLLEHAIQQGADVFVTADYKYHQFFDAENKIIIADIGHYESEYLTINYLARILKEKFITFAVLLTKVNTNPINYL